MGDEIQQLLFRTLEGGYDDDKPWDAISQLRALGTKDVFDVAAAWCESDNPLKRARGADVIAQLGKTMQHPSNSFPSESFAVISRMVEKESDARPLKAAIFALGHLDNSSAVSLISKHAAHYDAGVRFAVAFALGSYANEPRAVELLIGLSDDSDEQVRDWATFGLGVQSDADSVQVRDSLAARLTDTDADTREEAIRGLAKRRDRRAIQPLLDLLAQDDASTRAYESASLFLGMDRDDDKLSAADYVIELEKRRS